MCYIKAKRSLHPSGSKSLGLQTSGEKCCRDATDEITLRS